MAHPVHVRIEYRERHSRSRTLLRAPMVVLLVLDLAVALLLVVAWLAILATGRYPRALFGFVAGTLCYSTRIGCYWLLLTDRFPPFGVGAPTAGYPVDVWVEQPERLSRLTTGLRLVLAIPAWLTLYFLALFSLMMGFAAVRDLIESTTLYQARVAAYAWLLTDVYPWFQEECGFEPGPRGIQMGIEPAPE